MAEAEEVEKEVEKAEGVDGVEDCFVICEFVGKVAFLFIACVTCVAGAAVILELVEVELDGEN